MDFLGAKRFSYGFCMRLGIKVGLLLIEYQLPSTSVRGRMDPVTSLNNNAQTCLDANIKKIDIFPRAGGYINAAHLCFNRINALEEALLLLLVKSEKVHSTSMD